MAGSQVSCSQELLDRDLHVNMLFAVQCVMGIDGKPLEPLEEEVIAESHHRTHHCLAQIMQCAI